MFSLTLMLYIFIKIKNYPCERHCKKTLILKLQIATKIAVTKF